MHRPFIAYRALKLFPKIAIISKFPNLTLHACLYACLPELLRRTHRPPLRFTRQFSQAHRQRTDPALTTTEENENLAARLCRLMGANNRKRQTRVVFIYSCQVVRQLNSRPANTGNAVSLRSARCVRPYTVDINADNKTVMTRHCAVTVDRTNS